MQLSSSIRRYLPHLLVGVSIILIMVVAYASVGLAMGTTPKATWTTSPVTIIFTAASGTGTAHDSLTCIPSATGIVLDAKVSQGAVSLTASLATSSCSSSADLVTLTAHCLVPATQCNGSYSGLVQIRQPANYRNIPANLPVSIVVT